MLKFDGSNEPSPEPPVSTNRVVWFPEFVGTFILAMTAGLCGLNQEQWPTPWAIGGMTAALAYALSPVTGGKFNPAACVSLGIIGRMRWMAVLWCAISQLLAGLGAGLLCALVFGGVPVNPSGGHTVFYAAGCDAIYTFMLCFVILNCTETRVENHFFGLAIGLVYVAGGYAIGGISGVFLNPAIVIGMDASSYEDGILNGFIYAGFESVGAVVASGLFLIVRPAEDAGSDRCLGVLRRYLCEFVGTFMVVLTFGMGLVTRTSNMPWSVAACLTSMTYSLGDVSGAYFNPAVSLGVLLQRSASVRGTCDALAYCLVQLAAGCAAMVTCLSLLGGGRLISLPSLRYSSLLGALLAELLFSFVFVLVFLAVGLHSLACGACLIAAGFATEGISGAELNPAVTVGLAVASYVSTGNMACWDLCLYLSVAEISGSLLAAGTYRFLYPPEPCNPYEMPLGH